MNLYTIRPGSLIDFGSPSSPQPYEVLCEAFCTERTINSIIPVLNLTTGQREEYHGSCDEFILIHDSTNKRDIAPNLPVSHPNLSERSIES